MVEPAGFCEIDPWCRRVLAKHWPGVSQHDDIKTLTGDDLERFGRVHLITGGIPCQPYSVAGERRGDTDDRVLWPQMARVIDECRPTYCLVENVYGFISMALDGVSSDLEALGYTVRSLVVPAVAVDAQHRRDRLWIMAHADRCSTRSEIYAREKGNIPLPSISGETLADTQSITERKSTNKTNTIAACRHTWPFVGSGGGWTPESGVGGMASRVSAGLDGAGGLVADQWWPPEPDIPRTAHGVKHRVQRLKGLGNAIVPQVAYEILRVMLADEMEAGI